MIATYERELPKVKLTETEKQEIKDYAIKIRKSLKEMYSGEEMVDMTPAKLMDSRPIRSYYGY